MSDDWDPNRFYNPGQHWKDFRPRNQEDDPEYKEIGSDAWITPSKAFLLALECESPIEARLITQLSKSAPKGYKIKPQFKWKGWRMDFAILDPQENLVAFIECDGAEFHSTSEQIANDGRKEAAARQAGIRLFRFTGSKIYHEACECAASVWRWLGQ